MDARYKIEFLAPPGPGIVRPTATNPNPPSNPRLFTDAMTVRDKVFVDEQKCHPDSEMDEDDARSWMWVMYDTAPRSGTESKPKPIAVVRLVPPPHAPHEDLNPVVEEGVDTAETLRKEKMPFIRLTRVAVLEEYRGLGLSRKLVEHALRWMAETPEEVDKAYKMAVGKDVDKWEGLVLVHAQTQVEGIYKKLGFETDKGLGTWEEERIVHVGMWRELDIKRKN